ncbi:hypothetical protein [Nesterenkonia haasae]|nr:hypothetical protein [Nesterenkonia haasae]
MTWKIAFSALGAPGSSLDGRPAIPDTACAAAWFGRWNPGEC